MQRLSPFFRALRGSNLPRGLEGDASETSKDLVPRLSNLIMMVIEYYS